ncbi:hypothetical protein M413DRAFT_447727 [Hebeloma cylindrosporum]|uniref:BTB domain-containing protein n=1 Tax=Hebeloma cylindrosporum TaxID=76867 RepID=A0A0C3BP94_HEBCY|nr:hypothetical protein M413DRAFT_447727 [Hebeloma cylindrosporum h7]
MDNSAPTQDSDIWFEDGNIILEVEKTLFKVHRSILATHSPVFKKIFDEQSQFYQSPTTVPRLTCYDKAAHIKLLLQGVYNTTSFEGKTQCDHLKEAAGMIIMGGKYGVDFLFQRAVKNLSTIFPTTLDKWDQHSQSLVNSLISVAEQVDLIHALTVARVTWILPAAVYGCFAYRKPEEILASKFGNAPSMQTAFLLLFVNHVRLCRRGVSFVASLPAQDCSAKNECDGLTRRFYLDTLTWTSNDPLGFTSEESKKFKELVNQLCSKCSDKCSQAHKDSREAIWSDLPKVYGIGGSWAELKASEGNVASHLQFLAQVKNTASR